MIRILRRTRTPAYVVFDILWRTTVPPFDLCRSASAGSVCERFCRQVHQR
jgi:hypothetical protein